MQSMNGVNIHLFQFERDLTWMAFFMDANDRFYARYGGNVPTAEEVLEVLRRKSERYLSVPLEEGRVLCG